MLLSILDTQTLTIEQLIYCTLASAVIGLMIAGCHMIKNKCSKNFATTLVILPVIVQAVIMIVNGNVGTGVAVMGAFSLIRFRSVQGNSKEIGSIFLAMAAGIATGMGHITFAFCITLFICLLTLILNVTPFGNEKNEIQVLRIVVPESMDFEGAFDDILDKYAKSEDLVSVKTTNMGSLYELRYEIVFKEKGTVKKMTDEIRTRNGNLTVSVGRKQMNSDEL